MSVMAGGVTPPGRTGGGGGGELTSPTGIGVWSQAVVVVVVVVVVIVVAVVENEPRWIYHCSEIMWSFSWLSRMNCKIEIVCVLCSRTKRS